MKYRIRWKMGKVEGHGSWFGKRDSLEEIIGIYNREFGAGTHWIEELNV